MLSHMSAEEEAKLEAMQRAWQGRWGLSSSSCLESDTEEMILTSSTPSQQYFTAKNFSGKNEIDALTTPAFGGYESDSEIAEHERLYQKPQLPSQELSSVTLDGSSIGDFPARYTICALEPHQIPAVGTYIDPRIVPGFKYRVRPLPPAGPKRTSTSLPALFDNRALVLQSIGRGYARRLTFKGPEGESCHGPLCFWSDNRPNGYAFELELVSVGDKFTIFDANKEAQGIVEILSIECPQIEVSNSFSNLGIEKRANVRFTGKVEFYETLVAKATPLAGIAVAFKSKGKAEADVMKITRVVIKRQRYTLVPGIQTSQRRVTVRGDEINDVPTKYTMTGLENYEMPVVGTYVDGRIIPGFHYRIRPNHRRQHLFGGRALRLLSIGMGYAKRLTFEPDSPLSTDNHLWSDSHPDGLGLEVRAVREGMRFTIMTKDETLGQAQVFRADRPQREEKMEKITTSSGKQAVEKYIHIDVMCHVRLALPNGLAKAHEQLMRVYGLAVVRKEPNSIDAKVIRVVNVGMNSQLNLLFSQTHTELTFYPLP